MDEEKAKQLIQLVKDAGWQFAIPEGEGELKGMIIGEESYVDFILKHLD